MCANGLLIKCFPVVTLVAYLMTLWTTNTTIYLQQEERNNNKNNYSPENSGGRLPRSRLEKDNEGQPTGSNHQIIKSTNPDFPREPKPRPQLSSIVQGWNITGDPSWLLNLAIIGFPKTGTSTLMKYLHLSPQIQVFDEERCEIEYNQHVRLIESLYNDMPPGDFIRGIKCPRDLEVPIALKNYQKYFPATDFMIGLRHPIEWFESFYNFRVNNMFPMPPPDTLVGRCTRRMQGVCTFRGNFHLFLANLGKTNIQQDPNQQALIPEEYRKAIKPIPLKGRIFLWDISQLKHNNNDHNENNNNDEKRSDHEQYQFSNSQFREDLRKFLRLEEPLPEMIWVKPGYSHHKNQTLKDHVTSQKINICDAQYQNLRAILLRQASMAARWIRDYFLEADGVFVSQKEHFKHVILKNWEQDPCLDLA